ncbi:MAG: aldehyde ferredoxin oxidoreductase family protein [Deferrisomatales bacterium]
MSTIAGSLLRINLTERTCRREEIPAGLYREFLSARGLGVRYLLEELHPGVDPLGPDNKLIFGIGVLGGTRLQGFSKWSVVTKSPLTGTVFRSFTGGNLGVWMKWAGYDQVILEGASDTPCYVLVDAEGVEFLDARELMGRDPREVQERLKERHGPRTEAACIGLAGEKGVRFAAITAGERTASRGGVGAVMGAKNLKALAVRAEPRSLRGHDPDRLEELAAEQIRMLRTNPRRRTLHTLGTPYITTGLMEKGILPVRNFREGFLEGVEAISGDVFLQRKEGAAGCYGCMTRCGGLRRVERGPYAGTRIDGPEYETIFALGPLLGIADPQFIVDANALCDYYGMDTISAGVSAAFAVELFEAGRIDRSHTGGLELQWGDPEAALALLDQIARREGLGEILSLGVKRAAEALGGGAEALAHHIKGLELPGYEPRALKGYALSMATANIGGSHMYGRPREELAGRVDPYAETDKGAAIAEIQKAQAVEDSLIACTFGNSGLTLEDYGRFLEAATGLEELASADALLRIGERIVCAERWFNVGEGFGRAQDCLPPRMVREPLRRAGPATDQVVACLDTLLDEYYDALGYDARGIPTPETLDRLGLSEFAERGGGRDR